LLNLHNAGFYELNSVIIGMGILVGGVAQIIAGIEGIFCGLSAIYACAAQILNKVYGKTVLPIGKG
jgi:succinate-acetate transporter protein